MAAPIQIPHDLRQRHRRTPEGRAWLSVLPRYVAAAVERWKLTVDLPEDTDPWNGHSGIVIPVRTQAGAAAALKISFPYDEAVLEPVALKLWNGQGMVRILESDTASCAMVIDRLNAGQSLISVPMDTAVEVWGGLVRQLGILPDDRPEWAAIPHIAGTAEQFSDDLPARWEGLNRPFPRWLLEAALEVCQTRGAVSRRRARDVLVHTDLHYQNILATLDGTGYLGIDPQAAIGDAEFALAPCLWNRIKDLPQRNAEAALRRRAAALSAAAGLEEAIAVEWAVVREVDNALWYLENPGHDGDAQRSLWVASTMAGRPMPGLPAAHDLKTLQ
ncbi:aminoglycoside phosphotransferase family protein [Specibacter sp. RAF43]|uniref:aminoglycoside phosphotransferase family protein n=1 Tax=Specibacter sp. RAF43 TaxID=3233057 RepID=UPI003F9C9F76